MTTDGEAVRAGPPEAGSTWFDDWITIWHSELAAAVADPETRDTLLHLVDLWAAQAHRAAAALDRAAGPVPPARPAPAAAAPDGRDAVIAGLLARVAELERRLDGLDPRPGQPGRQP